MRIKNIWLINVDKERYFFIHQRHPRVAYLYEGEIGKLGSNSTMRSKITDTIDSQINKIIKDKIEEGYKEIKLDHINWLKVDIELIKNEIRLNEEELFDEVWDKMELINEYLFERGVTINEMTIDNDDNKLVVIFGMLRKEFAVSYIVDQTKEFCKSSGLKRDITFEENLSNEREVKLRLKLV